MSSVPGTHVAERPSWRCANCHQPWPCAPARRELTDGQDRVALAMSMWTYLEQAAADLHDPTADLFDRFIRWTH